MLYIILYISGYFVRNVTWGYTVTDLTEWFDKHQIIFQWFSENSYIFKYNSEIAVFDSYKVVMSSTHWFVWSPSISKTTPFSCSFAAVYFRDCGFHFLLLFSSPLLSSFIDLREFLEKQNSK